MKHKMIKELGKLRANDIYLQENIKQVSMDNFLPKNTLELTLDLSNVTSVFYGLAIKNICENFGKESANEISKKIFYDLGRLKTQQCKSKYTNLENNTKAFAYIIISAIYNASPEYSFEIIQFSKEETVVKIEGLDRYLRILSELKLEKYVEFPTLIPFMEGVRDELNLKCEIDYEMEIDKKENKTSTIYKFKMLKI